MGFLLNLVLYNYILENFRLILPDCIQTFIHAFDSSTTCNSCGDCKRLRGTAMKLKRHAEGGWGGWKLGQRQVLQFPSMVFDF